MHLAASAIVCSVRAHGEHGAIVRVLTSEAGLLAGYVRGARSRQMRAILVPGNAVAIQLRARSDDQIGAMVAELVHSRAAMLDEPLAAAAIDWVTVSTVTALPEGQAYPMLYQALCALLDAIELAPAARNWAGALAQYELLLLQSLGFGLALDQCVATGAVEDLGYVSPKSAAAVSRTAATGHEARLMPLPAFLNGGGVASLDDTLAGLRITGYFLSRRLFDQHRNAALSARERLIDRLQRAL